jgi:hypothetical protein
MNSNASLSMAVLACDEPSSAEASFVTIHSLWLNFCLQALFASLVRSCVNNSPRNPTHRKISRVIVLKCDNVSLGSMWRLSWNLLRSHPPKQHVTSTQAASDRHTESQTGRCVRCADTAQIKSGSSLLLIEGRHGPGQWRLLASVLAAGYSGHWV